MLKATSDTKRQLPSDQDATGRTLGEAELQLIAQAISSGTLTSTKGTMVKKFEATFAKMLRIDHAYACTSGTAALHTAIAAIDPEPGDEIVTTSITDMGALTPMLYQGAIPVFADVDPETYNVTAETIEARLSDRTKAIMVTHLFGNPCQMDEIMELARGKGIPVIEDCAQAFLATVGGKEIGTIGDIGCFSLQQGKHITTGEGGIVASNDPDLARRCFLFINKAWGYGDQNPDHYFLALNYRMNELTGAVALAQLDKLTDSVCRRVELANRMHELIAGIPGVAAPVIQEHNVHTFWKYCLNVDPEVIPGGTDALGAMLKERGVFCAPRYIQKPAFCCQVFRDQRTFGESRWPFTLARPEAVNYDDSLFPGTLTALANILVLPWNEKYTDDDVLFVADTIRESATRLIEQG
jgi:dTDP-4-amino-4,6-dideoxygalactose transaminase